MRLTAAELIALLQTMDPTHGVYVEGDWCDYPIIGAEAVDETKGIMEAHVLLK